MAGDDNIGCLAPCGEVICFVFVFVFLFFTGEICRTDRVDGLADNATA